ncbi:MAG: adenylate/guanylate cyclase domain-containing protein, partial [Desulfobulbia bacterium]
MAQNSIIPSRISVAAALAIFVGGAVLLTSGAILLLSWFSSEQNIKQVMSQRGKSLNWQVEWTVHNTLKQGPDAARIIAREIKSTNGFLTDKIATVVKTTLQASPAISRIEIYENGKHIKSAFTDSAGATVYQDNFSPRQPYTDIAGSEVSGALEHWTLSQSPTNRNTRQLLYVLHLRLGSDATVAIETEMDPRTLSNNLSESVIQEGIPFVLWKREFVVAHPRMLDSNAKSADNTVESFRDPVLRGIWRRTENRVENPGGLNGHLDSPAKGARYLFLYRDLQADYGYPFIAGLYIRASVFGSPLRHQEHALYIAGGILLLTILLSPLVARTVSRPVQRLAEAAKLLQTYDLSTIPELPRSRIKEIDEASLAFISARLGLEAFARFVPRTLVLRLLRQASDGNVGSELRDVTILFTDIAGYTDRAQKMSAEETANFLNEHFELVSGIVEEEGGTVDKFIGDSVMAFWGAPEKQPNHAERGARAAVRIAE